MFVNVLPLWLQGLQEVSRTDFGRKIKEGVEGAAKTAMHSAESLSKEGEKFGKTSAFRAISQVGREQSWVCFDFIVRCACVRLWVTSVECGDHEERDRCERHRALQSSASAEEKKRFLLQRSRQQFQSVWGQWVSNLWDWSLFSYLPWRYIFSLWVLCHSPSLITSLLMAALQRGNGSRSPQGFKVVPAVEGL